MAGETFHQRWVHMKPEVMNIVSFFYCEYNCAQYTSVTTDYEN